MKKYFLLNAALLALLALLVAGLVIALSLVYQEIGRSFAFKFFLGVLVYIPLLGLYLTTAILVNMRKLNRAERRKRLVSFLALFMVQSVLSFLLQYLLKPSKLDIWDWGIPLGLSMGISFYDLMFFGKKRNQLDQD